MNESFEAIRKELKKYNAEENEVPPKILVAGKDDLLHIDYKRKQNSQFIITVKEFSSSQKYLIENMLESISSGSDCPLLVFFFDNKKSIETVIEDFRDYYNMHIGADIFHTISSIKDEAVHFCLIIMIVENSYYK